MDFILGKLGTPGLAIAFVVWLAQYLTPEARQALWETAKGLWNTLSNIPRRYRSERDRVRAQVADLRAKGIEDEAAVKESKAVFKNGFRVAGGMVEDVGNSLVDLAFIILPIVVTAVKIYKRKKK